MRALVGILICMIATVVTPAAASPPLQDPGDPDAGIAPVEDPIETIPAPDARPPHIKAVELAEIPASGTGRLRIGFGGNRRWCTSQDDRILKPPVPPGRKPARGAAAITTFGYQMILAAVKRGSADDVILLFESPLVRTASWRPAAKAGLPPRTAKPSPQVSDVGAAAPPARRIAPDDLVPYWHEINRCATVAESMDFDLAPGVYDLYLAMDLLTRSGSYIHRATTFLLDVRVEAGRQTRVEGRIDMRGGGFRDLELLTAAPPAASGSPGSGSPSGIDGAATGHP